MNQNQKGVIIFLVIGIFVLALAVVAGVGYYWMNSQNQSLGNKNINASWTKYKNSDLGVEFDYPSNWESPAKGGGGAIFTAGISSDNDNYCVVDLSISSLYLNDLEIADLLAKEYAKISIKLNNVDGISLINNSPNDAGVKEVIYFLANGYSFRISRNKGLGNALEQECAKNFQQILSTLKISEKEKATTITAPTVKTLNPDPTNTTTINLSGIIENTGGASIGNVSFDMECGKNPGVYNEKLQFSSSGREATLPSRYRIRFINLENSTKYYCRAKVCNSTGCGYGEEIYFKTGSYYETEGCAVYPMENIVECDGKQIIVNNHTTIKCGDYGNVCSLSEICPDSFREKNGDFCNDYRFSLNTIYKKEGDLYYAIEINYTPQ